MIDFGNAIYSACAPVLREKFTGLNTTGEISDDEPKMPCWQMEETRNTPTEWENTSHAKYAIIQERVRIYCNDKTGRKQKARDILAATDAIMEPLNFRRTTFVGTNGLYNNSAYRIEANYEAVIDENGNIYRT